MIIAVGLLFTFCWDISLTFQIAVSADFIVINCLWGSDAVLEVNKLLLIFKARAQKLRKATVGFVMSVRLSAWKNSAPTGQIFMKFDIWVFFEKDSLGNSSCTKFGEE